MARLTLALLQRRLAAWWTLAAGLCVTAALGWELHREAVQLDRKRIVQRALELKSVLDGRLERSEMLLYNLRDYLTLSDESREPVFARWCYDNGLTINCPWILGIALATNRHEVDLRARLPKPPASWSEAEWETISALRRETPLECHLSLHSDLTEGRQFLPDYGLRCAYSDRDPGNAATSQTRLAGAVLESSLGMSHRQTVMLDLHGDPIVGTVFYMPVYRPELAECLAVPRKIDHYHRCARWLHLSAVIVAPVDFRRLIAKAEAEAGDLGIEIFSSTNHLTAETWLNRDRPTPRADDPAFSGGLTHRLTWPISRQRFTLFFYTTPLFEAQSPRRLTKTAIVAGLAVTLLATALVGLSVRARNRQDGLTGQIREARDALAAAQRERNRISRDLHDGTIQSLYAIQLGLGHTVEKIEGEPGRTQRELSAVRRDLDAVIAEIRQFITAEAEPEKAVDLGAVLHALVERVRPGTKAEIVLHCDPAATECLTVGQAVQLANIAREALSNSLRHAQPQRVEITLRPEPEAVVLEVRDDGAGFDPDAPDRTGGGLGNMTARAREMNGTLDLESERGRGTRVTVRVPASPLAATETESPDDRDDES